MHSAWCAQSTKTKKTHLKYSTAAVATQKIHIPCWHYLFLSDTQRPPTVSPHRRKHPSAYRWQASSTWIGLTWHISPSCFMQELFSFHRTSSANRITRQREACIYKCEAFPFLRQTMPGPRWIFSSVEPNRLQVDCSDVSWPQSAKDKPPSGPQTSLHAILNLRRCFVCFTLLL